MKIFGVEFKFNGFDIWHSGNFNPANKSDVGHTHDDRYYTESEIQNNSISMRSLYVNTNGTPTSNLGSPTVAEMALFEEQFNNKLAFYDISKFTFEYTTDGTNWNNVTSSINDTDKKKFVGGDGSANIVIPNGTLKYRITIRNSGSYVYLNALYMYWSSAGHSVKVQIWKKRDDGDWVQHTSATNNISAWPGHMYLPFATIPWSLQSTSGHYNEVRIEFTPTWNSRYPSNNIILYKLQLWGGYPAGIRRVFTIDENKNVTFPANVTATSFNGNASTATKLQTARTISLSGGVSGSASFDGSANVSISTTVSGSSHTHTKSQITDMPTKLSEFINDIGAGAGIKITTSSTAPSDPSPGDFWYKEL